eukprot:scaffold474623_cov36-Prasinocladus_malaysianus.AAC.3
MSTVITGKDDECTGIFSYDSYELRPNKGDVSAAVGRPEGAGGSSRKDLKSLLGTSQKLLHFLAKLQLTGI